MLSLVLGLFAIAVILTMILSESSGKVLLISFLLAIYGIFAGIGYLAQHPLVQ